MTRTRINSLDILRILATFAVVLFHVLDSSSTNDPELSHNLYIFVNAILCTFKWHVPVFFMITGFLWLSDEKNCTFEKVIPNLRRFVLVLFTVGYGYAIMEHFFSTRSISYRLLLESLQDVFVGNLWSHMWFVYSIIGIYLILPVIKPFFTYSSLKAISIFTGLLFFFTLISPILETYWKYSIPISFPFQKYLFYVSAGGLIAKWNPMSRKTVMISAVLFGFSTFSVFILKMQTTKYDDCIPLFTCISAISLFLTVTIFMKDAPDNLWIRNISDCSFGIYLLHPFFINVIIKLLHIYPLRCLPFISILGISVSIAIMSFFSIYFLRKILWVKKYIL